MSAKEKVRRWRCPAAGFVTGCLAGATALTVGTVAAAPDATPMPRHAAIGRGLRDVLHAPPLLVQPGAPVTLRYDVVCQADELGAPCSLGGQVFVRGNGDSDFGPITLTPAGDSALTATVPLRYAQREGFQYYAVIEAGDGETATVPEGGAAAPQRVWPVAHLAAVDLGTHAFGRVRRPDGTALSADWGSGPRALGVRGGADQATIGPSAFDVSSDGSLVVLDQVNDRLAVYAAGGAAPRSVPIPFAGGEGDLAAGDDASVYVLDHGGPAGDAVVRSFTPAGDPAGVTKLAGRSPDMLRTGPGGAFVHAYPGDMWLPVGRAGLEIQPGVQTDAARAGRKVAGDLEIVVDAGPAEALFALVRQDQILRAWRVSSATTLGEVQLAEPFGDGLLVVLRLWAERKAEFVVLVLTRTGLAESFAVEPAEWAESAPLSRFRLHHGTLYQLRTTPSRAAIVTFSLGGAR